VPNESQGEDYHMRHLTQRFWTSEEGQDEILVLTAVSRVDTFTMQVGQYPAAGGFIHDAH